MNTSKYLLPFTLCGATGHHSQNLIELSWSRTQPTALVACSFSTGALEGAEGSSSRSLEALGSAVGCEDGSIYIFHPISKHRGRLSSSSNDTSLLDPTTIRLPPPFNRSKLTPSASRSTSPSSVRSSLAPFTVSSRSGVVSGLSLEQAEAPKNYVDFDDEPEKLKDMLKGKGPKDRTTSDGLTSHSPSSSRSLLSPQGAPGIRRNGHGSVVSSPPSTSTSASRAPSPTFSSAAAGYSPHSTFGMSLKFHIFPSCFGCGHAITDMQLLGDHQHLLCLQESGHVSVFSMKDGSCVSTTRLEDEFLSPPSGIRPHDTSFHAWAWKRIQVMTCGEVRKICMSLRWSTLILASATDLSASSTHPPTTSSADHRSTEEDVTEVTRVAVLEFRGDSDNGYGEISRLEKVGDWCVEGPLCGPGLCTESASLDADRMTFFYINSSHHLITHQLHLLPRASTEATPSPDNAHNSLPHLPLPNPFKALKMRSTEQVSVVEPDIPLGRIELGDEADLGDIGGVIQGPILGVKIGQSRVVAWSYGDLTIFEINFEEWTLTQVLSASITGPGIKDVTFIGSDSHMVTCTDRVEVYALHAVDPNNDEIQNGRVGVHPVIIQQKLSYTIPLPNHMAMHVHLSSPHEVLLIRQDDKGTRRLQVVGFRDPPSPQTPRAKSKSKRDSNTGHGITVWKSKQVHKGEETTVTAILPLELNTIILGYDDGHIRRSSFSNLAVDRLQLSPQDTSDNSLDGMITILRTVENDRTGQQVLVGGADDGSVAFWELSSLKLTARWTIFTVPLQKVIQIREGGNLKGCALCISQGGTIAVIAIDGCQFLYLIPGSIAPLKTLYVGDDNILLVYSNGWGRLWDTKTQEFRRSMTWDKAEEIVVHGQGWVKMRLEDERRVVEANSELTALTGTFTGVDAASTLLIDIESIVNQMTYSIQALVNEKGRRVSSGLVQYRAILSALLTPELSEDIDKICRDRLGIQASPVSVGFVNEDTTVLFGFGSAGYPWTISPEVSAARALAVIAVLRCMMQIEHLADDATTVMAFYAASLEPVIGPSYQPPSLPFLANRWFDSSNELRVSIQFLFDAGLAHLSDGEIASLIDKWQHSLPFLQPDNGKQMHIAAMSLFLCGNVAATKYSLLSTSALSDISKSIALYLHDEQSLHRTLAIDLCSRGFTVWQQYVDAMEMLRALFLLATNSRKESISTQNAGPQARAAVLRIASSNSPLFMTTLALDILHPQNMEHRKSVMQLVAFFIRKQPLVLYPNLPRLVEAVVKSLDPNSTASREAVLDAATEILGHVVKTFPTVDFHMATQRLAVGTSEGAVIMYNLKTATRLYVLECHKKKLVACSFSPDGRRLVTVSLEEGVVLVWKVGSSFSSFFTPGAPPRQGHSGSEPFKRLSFNVGDEAKMTIADTLEFIRFEWPADRSVRLKIRDSILTFGT